MIKGHSKFWLFIFLVLFPLLWSNSASPVDVCTAERTRQTIQILSPDNGTEVNGIVIIDVRDTYCNCSGNSSLYIDKDFTSLGVRYDLVGQYEYFRHEWNTTTVENGLHEILIFDKHDVAYDIIYLLVNNAGSGGAVRNTRITSPGNNTNIQGLVTVHAEVLTCNCSGLTSLYVDDVFITNGTYEATINHDGRWWELFTHSWDSSTVENGEHIIRVNGKHTEYFHEINVTVENEEEEPNTKIISLHNNTEIHGNQRVSIRVMACKCNATTTLYVDGLFISNGTKGGSVGEYEYFSHEWDSTAMENGRHILRVYGKHKEFYDEITVFVNNTAQGSVGDLRILAPEINSEISGIVTVRIEVVINVRDAFVPVVDGGDDRLVCTGARVYFNATGYDNVGIVKYTWTFTYNDTEYVLTGKTCNFRFMVEGNYSICFGATDEAGNRAQDHLWVNVTSTSTEDDDTVDVDDEDDEDDDDGTAGDDVDDGGGNATSGPGEEGGTGASHTLLLIAAVLLLFIMAAVVFTLQYRKKGDAQCGTDASDMIAGHMSDGGEMSEEVMNEKIDDGQGRGKKEYFPKCGEGVFQVEKKDKKSCRKCSHPLFKKK